MWTLAIWCRVVQSRDVMSRVFSRPAGNRKKAKQPEPTAASALGCRRLQTDCSLMATELFFRNNSTVASRSRATSATVTVLFAIFSFNISQIGLFVQVRSLYSPFLLVAMHLYCVMRINYLSTHIDPLIVLILKLLSSYSLLLSLLLIRVLSLLLYED